MPLLQCLQKITRRELFLNMIQTVASCWKLYFSVLCIISMPNNCHECMKELSINTNVNLYLFLFFIWYFRKTLGSPMVVMSVWKSFVATNPDALRYFTIYNWRRWNRNCNGCTCNCKVCPAILYNYLHWQRPGPAFTAGLYNYSCSAIDCNAMAEHLSQ